MPPTRSSNCSSSTSSRTNHETFSCSPSLVESQTHRRSPLALTKRNLDHMNKLVRWWRLKRGTPQTCPTRQGWVDGFKDVWMKVDHDRVCSYCGSIHPDEMMRFLPHVDGMGFNAELSDNRRIVLVRRPGLSTVQFNLAHAPVYDSDFKLFTSRLNDALSLSRQRALERWKGRQESLAKRKGGK